MSVRVGFPVTVTASLNASVNAILSPVFSTPLPVDAVAWVTAGLIAGGVVTGGVVTGGVVTGGVVVDEPDDEVDEEPLMPGGGSAASAAGLSELK